MMEHILGLGASLTLYTALAAIVGAATTLMVYCKYDDGLVGRVCLGGMVFFGALVLIEATSVRYEIAPELALFLAAAAGFHCWHLWRFHRRMLRLRALEREDPERTIPPGLRLDDGA